MPLTQENAGKKVARVNRITIIDRGEDHPPAQRFGCWTPETPSRLMEEFRTLHAAKDWCSDTKDWLLSTKNVDDAGCAVANAFHTWNADNDVDDCAHASAEPSFKDVAWVIKCSCGARWSVIDSDAEDATDGLLFLRVLSTSTCSATVRWLAASAPRQQLDVNLTTAFLVWCAKHDKLDALAAIDQRDPSTYGDVLRELMVAFNDQSAPTAPTTQAPASSPPKAGTCYVYRELKVCNGETEPRLLVPWSDPHQHEHAFDYRFDSAEEARTRKQEEAPDENWVLCLLTLTPVAPA